MMRMTGMERKASVSSHPRDGTPFDQFLRSQADADAGSAP